MAAKLSGSDGGKHDIEQNHDINVTPFVDVMLVLLIIFMVCAPLAAPPVHVDLPPAIAKPTPNPAVPIYITIETNGALHLGNNPTYLRDLGGDLRKVIGDRDPSKQRVFIRADKEAVYGDFMGVVSKLQENGFYSVALIGIDQNSKKSLVG